MLDKFSSHEGSIKAFCEENSISAHQLYYRRKKLQNNNTPVFHAVSFKDKEADEAVNQNIIPPNPVSASTIKIEIGKAKIYIPSNDKVSLSNVFKEIIALC
ncbi:hypothetical protein BJL90_18740 [Clostridium formicaceticum]|uniref:Transposase n=1 Tax=Clostridium formicaceticum TaxID=1497 RepID=A0ABN4TAM0_9CLOT|nr:hypothetical protein BJL90_01075 [Clostridium formicaceticum]AOY78186.1 hypothetical protein BJL90_01215 [Clostridium formicaceticum]AOY78212.1 hypothetical protein BJL90_02905 [Clostridium formicaceticum]AOY78239.1 hypothetical protein BJL90_05040 [Clostridium formicaceticum]AOY78361.1 hypothetical protein BJL90_13230 [Clostridium formicaceticum]